MSELVGAGGGPKKRKKSKKRRAVDIGTVLAAAAFALTLWQYYQGTKASQANAKGFVSQIEDVLHTAKSGRIHLLNALADVEHCRLYPSVARQKILTVRGDDRQVEAHALAAIGRPTEADQKTVLSALSTAIDYSTKADTHYAEWLASIDAPTYYTAKREATPTGCPLPTGGDAFQQAKYESTQATYFKQRFVRRFNPLAAQYGSKHDWRWSRI